jgi:hypothetical protein
MFLGPDGWRGIDIGPVGAAVLYAALWVLAFHVSRHSEEAFPADSPLAERMAWVAVVFVTLIALNWVNFISALRDLGDGAEQIWNSASRPFSWNLGLLLVGWIVVASVVRGRNRETVGLDERDLRIQHAADRAGSGLTALLIVAMISALATQPELLAPWLRPLIVANALIGLLMAKTLTENVFTVVRYRRQFA